MSQEKVQLVMRNPRGISDADVTMMDGAVDALRDLIESASQAPHDFCGDQRSWHCPRLARAMAFFMSVFPAQALSAMETAKTPYGDSLVD